MNEINDTKQDIDKNKELLKIYQGHKDFMMQVYEENNESKKFKQDQIAKYNDKYNDAKEDYLKAFEESLGIKF